MTTRLHVVMDESELRQIHDSAQRRGLTISEWVRSALRAALRAEPGRNTGRKLEAIRAAARHAFPTGNIEDMLAEITRRRLKRSH